MGCGLGPGNSMANISSYTGRTSQQEEENNRQSSAVFSWDECAKRSNGDCNYLVCLNGDIFMKGGDQVFHYMPTQDRWSVLRFSNRLYCGLCIWDGKIALIGGKEGRAILAGSKTVYQSSEETAIGSIIVCDQYRWVAAGIPNMPIPCIWPAVTADQGGRSLLVIGGMDVNGTLLSHVQIYNSSTREWFCAQSLPTPCSNASCVIWENAVYVVGGDGLGTDVYCANLNELCDSREVQLTGAPTLRVWKKLPSLLFSFCSLCVIDAALVAIGGTAGRLKSSSVYALSTVTVSWKHVGDLHLPCACLAVVLGNSELICMERGAGNAVFKGKAIGLRDHLQQLDGTWHLIRQADEWIGCMTSS